MPLTLSNVTVAVVPDITTVAVAVPPPDRLTASLWFCSSTGVLPVPALRNSVVSVTLLTVTTRLCSVCPASTADAFPGPNRSTGLLPPMRPELGERHRAAAVRRHRQGRLVVDRRDRNRRLHAERRVDIVVGAVFEPVSRNDVIVTTRLAAPGSSLVLP